MAKNITKGSPISGEEIKAEQFEAVNWGGSLFRVDSSIFIIYNSKLSPHSPGFSRLSNTISGSSPANSSLE